MHTLVIYYSLTGNTRKVGNLLAERLNADIAEITCPVYRRGLAGGLRQAWDILTGGTPPIEVPVVDSNEYDLIIAGGPVWAGRPAPPLRGFVGRHLRGRYSAALFLTCNGTAKNFPGEKALRELARTAPRSPVATRLFREAEIASPDIAERVARFAKVLNMLKLTPAEAG